MSKNPFSGMRGERAADPFAPRSAAEEMLASLAAAHSVDRYLRDRLSFGHPDALDARIDLCVSGACGRSVEIEQILVPDASKGRGIGSHLLDAVIAQSEAFDVDLHLRVVPQARCEGLDYGALEAWYTHRGFGYTHPFDKAMERRAGAPMAGPRTREPAPGPDM